MEKIKTGKKGGTVKRENLLKRFRASKGKASDMHGFDRFPDKTGTDKKGKRQNRKTVI